MKSRLATIICTALAVLAGTGVAVAQHDTGAPQLLVHQLLADNASAMEEQARRSGATPLWSSRDGRLMAIIARAQPAGAPIQPLAPQVNGVIDWRLVDVAAPLSTGLRWNAGSGIHLDALVSQPHAAAAAPALSQLWMASLGLGWSAPGGTFDASYGINWFGNSHAATPAADWTASALPMGGLLQLDSGVALRAQTRWQPGPGTSIDLGASYGRSHFAPIGPVVGPADVDVDQAQLSLGLRKGTVSGGIIGHVAQSDDPGFPGALRRWTGIDLGVSWRTPWQGVFSIGAQNIWSAPLDSPPRDSVMDGSAARTPYVQYRQDL